MKNVVQILNNVEANSTGALPGGWRILKSRNDKDANHSSVASKVWETITGEDLRDMLQDTLSSLKSSYFDSGKKRPRKSSEEMNEDEFD